MNITIAISVTPAPEPVEIDRAVTPRPATSPLPSSEGPKTKQAVATLNLQIGAGKTLFVTGPNGVGKSSLLSTIDRSARAQGARIETFFGNRQIQFQSEDVDQVGFSIEQLAHNIQSSVTRYYHPWGEHHLKSVLRRLIDLQAQATHDVFKAQQGGATFEEAKAAYPLLIDLANSIFSTASLPIQIDLISGRLRARRGNAEYSIHRLSDGERAALLLVGAVLIQPPQSFIVIDEPERHLNPAISGALLAAVVRARPDLGFIFASHDLQLLSWLRPEQILHLRNSSVIHSDREERQYDITVLTESNDLSEELQAAVLGTRRKLLLVEGETSSEDQALYTHIYPAWNVVARGSWETVTSGVRSLNGNQKYHWLHTAGIIDRDGRDAAEQAILSGDQIFCLPVTTIENLFLHSVVLEEMASKISELKGAPTGAERIEKLKAILPELLQNSRDDVIIKRVVWEANRRNSEQKVSVKSLRQGQTEIARIDLEEIKARLEVEFDKAASCSDPIAILLDIPIKNSAIPNHVVRQLGFENFKDYARSVLRQIEIDSPAGAKIIDALRRIMPELAMPHAS